MKPKCATEREIYYICVFRYAQVQHTVGCLADICTEEATCTLLGNYRVNIIRMHTKKKSHTHVKDAVVHVRVRWTMETTK